MKEIKMVDIPLDLAERASTITLSHGGLSATNVRPPYPLITAKLQWSRGEKLYGTSLRQLGNSFDFQPKGF